MTFEDGRKGVIKADLRILEAETADHGDAAEGGELSAGHERTARDASATPC